MIINMTKLEFKEWVTHRHCVWVAYGTGPPFAIFPLIVPSWVTVDVDGPVTTNWKKSNLI